MRDESFPKSPETISLRLASLKSSSIAELKRQWQALYHAEPPHRISRELLAVPWHTAFRSKFTGD